MEKEYYINIQWWMVQNLKLTGNELLTYAIVYGFSQDGESKFLGGSKFVSYALGVSRPTAIKALDSLTKKGLIIKSQDKINDVAFNRYKVSLQAIKNLYIPYKESLQGGYKESLQGGYKESLHSNKYKEINNKNNKGIYKQVADLFNETCVSFPKVTALSDKRKKAIHARLATYTVEDFKRCFEMAEQSDFLKGKNNRDWSANFDWIIKDANFAKILDGNYQSRSQKPQQQETPTQEKPKIEDLYDENGNFDVETYNKYYGFGEG